MSNYSTNKIDTAPLKSWNSAFKTEKKSFSNSAYSSFSNSYINSCSDSAVLKMLNKLSKLYDEIDLLYKNIENWWDSYISNAEALENYIAKEGSLGSITDGEIRGLITGKLNDLQNFEFKYEEVKLASETNINLNQLMVMNSLNQFDYNKYVLHSYKNRVQQQNNKEDIKNEIIEALGFNEYAKEDIAVAHILLSLEATNEAINDVNVQIKALEYESRYGKKRENYLEIQNSLNEQKESLQQSKDLIIESMASYFDSTSEELKSIIDFYNSLKEEEKQSFYGYPITVVLEKMNTSNSVESNETNEESEKNWFQRLTATKDVACFSILEGLLDFGESMLDTMAMANTASFDATYVDTAQYLVMGKNSSGNVPYESFKDEMWENTQAFVANNYVGEAFDWFYNDTKIGQEYKKDAYGFDTVRSVGTGIGYFGGATALTIATGGLGGLSTSASTAILTTAAGVGKHTEAAWSDGATLQEGLAYGAARGAWDGFEVWLGGKIGSSNISNVLVNKGVMSSSASVLTKQLINTGSHVVMDTADAVTSAFMEPLLKLIYTPNEKNMDEIMSIVNKDGGSRTWDELSLDEKYSALFEYNGGFQTVFSEALMGAFMSGLSEVGDISHAIKTDDILKNINQNIEIDSNIIKSIDELDDQNLAQLLNSLSSKEKFNDVVGKLDINKIANVSNQLDNATLIKMSENKEFFDLLSDKQKLRISKLKDNLKEKSYMNETKQTISELGDSFLENIDLELKDIVNGKTTQLLPKSLLSFFMSPITLLTKFRYSSVLDDVDITKKMVKDGIYHFTDIDSAQKILDSGYVKKSSNITSYGSKKSFFFAGTPDLETLAINISDFAEKRVAVKINVDGSDIGDFKYRKYNDLALAYEGDYHFDQGKASIVYLGLVKENGNLVYKEISKAEYDNYKPNFSQNMVTEKLNNLKAIALGLAKDYEYTIEGLKRLKNTFANAKIKDTNSVVSGAKSILSDSLEIKEFRLSKNNLFSVINFFDDASFNSRSIDQQIDYVTNVQSGMLIQMLHKSDFVLHLDDSVKKIFDQRLVKEFNFLDLNITGRDVVAKYLSKDIDLLSQLSNDNLMVLLSIGDKNLNSISYDNLCKEVNLRLDNNSLDFDMSYINKKNFGVNFVVPIRAYLALPEDLQIKLRNKTNILINEYVSKELNDLPVALFTQKTKIATMIRDGKIDADGIKIIQELQSENINNINTFNYGVLDKDILNDFNTDFIKEIGKYDYLSYKLIELKEYQSAYSAFKKIYDDSILDDSLDTFTEKIRLSLKFLYENRGSMDGVENIDSSILLDYIFLNNNHNSLNIDLSSNYYNELYDACDKEFAKCVELYEISPNATLWISEMKEYYFRKYFSLSKRNVDDMLFKYYDHLDEISKYLNDSETEKCVTVLNYLKDISETTDIEYLKNIYNNQEFRFSSEEILYIDSVLREKYAMSYVDALSATNDSILNDSMLKNYNYNGMEVKVVEATNDFSLLVHSSHSGFTADKEILNDSFIYTWNNIDNANTHGLSTSYITNENIGSCPVLDNGVLYGFTNIDASNFMMMGSYDINSNIADYGFSSNQKQQFISADNLSKNTTRVYNEIVLDRSKVKPSCLILFEDASDKVVDNTYKAAYEWNIPVVKINKKNLAQSNANKIQSLVTKFDQTKDLDYLKSALELYESNVSGFRLNVIENAKDPTNIINNSSLISTFDSTNLSSTLDTYLDDIIKTNNTDEMNKLLNIFEQIEDKYNVANSQGTSVISKTHTGLDIENWITKIKGVLNNE